MAETTVITNPAKRKNIEGISPISDSSKLTLLFVIDGSARDTTNAIPDPTISKIPTINAAIFIFNS
jgi:hypothetical protein